MNKANLKYGLIALVGLGISANVSAADLSCDDIVFSPEAFAAYEFIDQACLDVVERNGGMFAKFTARVVAQSRSGTTLRYSHSDGSFGPSHRSNAPADFQAVIGGTAIKLGDMAVRQDMNIYVSDSYWSVPVAEAPAAPVAAAAAVVAAAAPPPPPPPPAPEPEPEPEPEMLPMTAGSLPWLVVFGSMFLILGGALRFARKQ